MKQRTSVAIIWVTMVGILGAGGLQQLHVEVPITVNVLR